MSALDTAGTVGVWPMPWFGKAEDLFGTERERAALVAAGFDPQRPSRQGRNYLQGLRLFSRSHTGRITQRPWCV